MPDKRGNVNVRIRDEALTQIDTIAQEQEWTRSQVIRKLLAFGLTEWQKGKR